MYEIERKDKIVEILQQKKSCSVKELARILNYSEATIRRDLNGLDKEMKIRKTFGGAVIAEQFGSEVPVAIRSSENNDIKKRLCAAAGKLISDNMTLFLAASTTLAHLVPLLYQYKNLTVITNDPGIPGQLSDSDITVYSTGGRYLHHSNAYVGEFAQNMIRGINADLFLFSARGISEEGKVTFSSTEDDVHRAMMENAAKTCLLFDSSKYGKTYSYTLCNLKDIDVVITDRMQKGFADAGNVIELSRA